MEIGSLVFARRLNEAFTIYTESGDIVVSIKEINASSKQVRLCVKAPKNIRILRDDAVDVKPNNHLLKATVVNSNRDMEKK